MLSYKSFLVFAALTALVSAQSGGVPACVLTCLGPEVYNGPCTITEPSCFCTDPAALGALETCVTKACKGFETELLGFLVAFCPDQAAAVTRTEPTVPQTDSTDLTETATNSAPVTDTTTAPTTSAPATTETSTDAETETDIETDTAEISTAPFTNTTTTRTTSTRSSTATDDDSEVTTRTSSSGAYATSFPMGVSFAGGVMLLGAAFAL